MRNSTPFSGQYAHELELFVADKRGGLYHVNDPGATFVVYGNDVEGYGCFLLEWIEPCSLPVPTAKTRADAVLIAGEAAVEAEECRALARWMDAEGVTLEPARWAMGA